MVKASELWRRGEFTYLYAESRNGVTDVRIYVPRLGRFVRFKFRGRGRNIEIIEDEEV